MSLDIELALRAAVNVLRDSAESGRMPSGEPLNVQAVDMHRQAADQLDRMRRAVIHISTAEGVPTGEGGQQQ